MSLPPLSDHTKSFIFVEEKKTYEQLHDAIENATAYKHLQLLL